MPLMSTDEDKVVTLELILVCTCTEFISHVSSNINRYCFPEGILVACILWNWAREMSNEES